MRKTRIGVLLLASAMLLAGLATPTAAGAAGRGGSHLQATARAGVLPASRTTAGTTYWKSFTWNGTAVGDCTRFQGATWTLYYDVDRGTTWASWDATVTSSDNNDAWLMWAHLQDANHAELGLLGNANIQNGADHNEFIQNMPDHTQRYRWLATGTFDKNRYWMIANMRLDNHC